MSIRYCVIYCRTCGRASSTHHACIRALARIVVGRNTIVMAVYWRYRHYIGDTASKLVILGVYWVCWRHTGCSASIVGPLFRISVYTWRYHQYWGTGNSTSLPCRLAILAICSHHVENAKHSPVLAAVSTLMKGQIPRGHKIKLFSTCTPPAQISVTAHAS